MPRSIQLLRRYGGLVTIGISLATMAGRADAATGAVTYTYDALGRISGAIYDTGVCIAYAYDANGNRTSEKIVVLPAAGTGYWNCFAWNSGKWN